MHSFRLTLTIRSFFGLFWLSVSLLLPKDLGAQNSTTPVANWVESCRNFSDFRPVALFNKTLLSSKIQNVVDHACVLTLDQSAVTELLQVAPQALHFTIPTEDGTVELELVQVEILAPEFSISTDAQKSVSVPTSIHYRGIVMGDVNSIACISVSTSGIMGMVADNSGNFELGQLEDGSGKYIYYKTQHLKALSPNNCFADEESLSGDDGSQPVSSDRGVGCKTVQVYFECDYKLYTDKGSSIANVNSYVGGLFNQIATLYANENIGVSISQIFVWTTPDPYLSFSTISSVLNSFRQTRGTAFNGNLAHLLSTRSLGGGIAYVDVVCVKSFAFGVSAITTTYQNVPTYSWSVEVVTHELGHNLGSWHTHSCNWPLGPIDNCAAPEGSCNPGPAPVNGGTIMSYCHMTNNGINFNKGFGPFPGDRIRDRVLNAACIPQSGLVPTGLAASAITGNSASLTWTPVPGATSYTVQYKLSTSGVWINAGTTIAPIFNLTNLTANSIYNWQVKTDCSNFSSTANFTTTSGGAPPCDAPTGLNALTISSNSATLVWNAVSGATTYQVQYKASTSSVWISAGSTASLLVNLSNLTASTAYDWQVKANCSVWSATSKFTTLASGGGGGGGLCNPPGNLNNNIIGSSTATISWSGVFGATNYTLQIKLASSNNWFTIGVITNTVTTLNGLLPNTSYHWRVKANCSDYSAIKSLITTANLGGGGNGNLSQPGIAENNDAVVLRIYPNPATEVLNILCTGDISQGYHIRVTDAIGRVTFEDQLQTTIDVSSFTPGIYFVTLMNETHRISTQRFVKI